MPNFKGKINLYISSDVKHIFEEFDKLRPNNLSFSSFIVYAINEYLKNKNRGFKKMASDENVQADYLYLLAPMNDWEREIHSLTGDEFKKVHTRVRQLSNLVNIEVNKRI